MANTALITGSTGGLGSCFVMIHAEKGGNLILVGIGDWKLSDCAKATSDFGIKGICQICQIVCQFPIESYSFL